MSNFPSKIKKLRTEKGLTQKQIAESLNVSQNAIYNWENGKREPNLDMIKQIAKYFDFPLYLLLDDNYELGDIALEKKRARIMGDTEMTEPPKPFTVSIINNNINKYDTTIIHHNLSPETIGNLTEISRIYKKIENDDKLTEKELQILKDYNQRQETAMKRLRELMHEQLGRLEKLQSAYKQLNEIGQEEAAKRIQELTEIPRYTKPHEPPA